MAKKQDFMSKLTKGQKKGQNCPVCGQVYSHVKKVDSYFSEDTNAWKYKTASVRVCACNEKEVYA
ncbi:MAG: hypothetical protein Kow0042_04500 [Calditrichia bacterium]